MNFSNLRSLLHANHLDTRAALPLIQEFPDYAQSQLHHRFTHARDLQALLDCFALMPHPTKEHQDKVHRTLSPLHDTPDFPLLFERLAPINFPQHYLTAWHRRDQHTPHPLVATAPTHTSNPYLHLDHTLYHLRIELEAFSPRDIPTLRQPFQEAARVASTKHRTAVFHTRHKGQFLISVGTFTWGVTMPTYSPFRAGLSIAHGLWPFQLDISHTWVFSKDII